MFAWKVWSNKFQACLCCFYQSWFLFPLIPSIMHSTSAYFCWQFPPLHHYSASTLFLFVFSTSGSSYSFLLCSWSTHHNFIVVLSWFKLLKLNCATCAVDSILKTVFWPNPWTVRKVYYELNHENKCLQNVLFWTCEWWFYDAVIITWF